MPNGKATTQIRVSEALFDQLKAISELEMRSLNAQMEYFLKEAATRYMKENNCFWDSINGFLINEDDLS